MEVILAEDIEKLGKKNEIVNVKDGYFRNFLFPHGKAVPCTPSNLLAREERKARAEKRAKDEKEKAAAFAKQLEKISVTLKAKVGEEDKLFGSITQQEIAKALQEKGIEIDKRKIEMEEPIKKTGAYSVKIRLHPEVETTVQVKVVKG